MGLCHIRYKQCRNLHRLCRNPHGSAPEVDHAAQSDVACVSSSVLITEDYPSEPPDQGYPCEKAQDLGLLDVQHRDKRADGFKGRGWRQHDPFDVYVIIIEVGSDWENGEFPLLQIAIEVEGKPGVLLRL